ncbi:MAG: prolipoprotein diacylglyceryl transferase [Anaerolineaceae bacterium]|nr:prolipoprotein diacylglyceryl transferase [Anaerolineaceae bacterium]
MSTGFQIGSITIHYYGIIIMFGALAAAWLADREAKRRGEDNELVWDAMPWLLVAGIVGARLWHILTPPASMVEQGITTGYYLTHPLDAIAIWNGGVGIPGAVIGGIIALYLYTRNKKVNFGTWVDIIAPGLALAQAIGRWGNFVNQELYGAPTNLPWAIFIEPQYRLPGYQDVAYYHPLFLYESLINLANMAFLLWLGRRWAARLKPGDIFLTYLIIYPVCRFCLEFLRMDPSPVAGLNVNQTLMGVVAISSTAFLIWRHRSGRPVDTPAPIAEQQDENE